MARPSKKIEYRSLPGYSGYRVGSDGSVWTRKNARWGLRDEYKLMRPSPCNESGHLFVHLVSDDGKRRQFLVHRLVLEAFVGPCPPGMQACHSPGRSPSNNNLANLRWDTFSNNQLDRALHGTDQRGAKNHYAKLTEIQAMEAIRRCTDGESRRDVANSLGVTAGCIGQLVTGRTWRNIHSTEV